VSSFALVTDTHSTPSQATCTVALHHSCLGRESSSPPAASSQHLSAKTTLFMSVPDFGHIGIGLHCPYIGPPWGRTKLFPRRSLALGSRECIGSSGLVRLVLPILLCGIVPWYSKHARRSTYPCVARRLRQYGKVVVDVRPGDPPRCAQQPLPPSSIAACARQWPHHQPRTS
jgi:hypothetical protein